MKEEIIAEISNQPQKHAEKWETYIDHEDGFESWLYLDNIYQWSKGEFCRVE